MRLWPASVKLCLCSRVSEAGRDSVLFQSLGVFAFKPMNPSNGIETASLVATSMRKRSSGLVVIVFYKAITAALLVVISISLILATKKQPQLLQFEDSLTLAGKRGIIAWVLEKILNLNPKTLQLSGILAGVYAGVSMIEAVGLWYEKMWARWLTLCLVAIGVLPEIFELIKGFSILKLMVLIANLGVFIYLLRDVHKQH